MATTIRQHGMDHLDGAAATRRQQRARTAAQRLWFVLDQAGRLRAGGR